MIYYAVIDTNVLVSALMNYNSTPGRILQICFDGLIVPLFSDSIIKEYKEVLGRKKFDFDSKEVKTVIDRLIEIGIIVDPDELDMDMPDLSDKPFFEVVMEKRKDEEAYLVTGNKKHFPGEPFVVTPMEMYKIVFNGLLL